MRKKSTVLTTICTLVASFGCNNQVLTYSLEDKIISSLPERIKPDRTKKGVVFPLFIDVSNLDEQPKKIQRQISLVAHDFKPKKVKEFATRGEFMIPQIEAEYFLNETSSINLRLGFAHYSIHSKDFIYPLIPLRSNIKVNTNAFITIIGTGIDFYPIRHDTFRLVCGVGLDTYYYNMNQKVKITTLSVPLHSYKKYLEGYGSTAYVRAGIEISPRSKISPKDLSFLVAAEHHFSVYDSDLDGDAAGTRLLIYMIRDKRNY